MCLLCQLPGWLHDQSHHTGLLLPWASRGPCFWLEWNQVISLTEGHISRLETRRRRDGEVINTHHILLPNLRSVLEWTISKIELHFSILVRDKHDESYGETGSCSPSLSPSVWLLGGTPLHGGAWGCQMPSPMTSLYSDITAPVHTTHGHSLNLPFFEKLMV